MNFFIFITERAGSKPVWLNTKQITVVDHENMTLRLSCGYVARFTEDNWESLIQALRNSAT